MSNEPEKLDLASPDIAEEKRHTLLRLFPEVRTEGGRIDFERLKAVLGEMVDTGRERYGMNWPGKAESLRVAQTPSMATLLPCPDESVDWDSTENMIIEGDNLEVLKLLQKSYLGKVKMIYIDPPYNTGNDFIYPDNYSESLQTYLEYTGQVDAQGHKFGTNADTDGRFHSKWLSMMYPRLYLARSLLSDDGLIFISIDDGEVADLRALCNAVFGEETLIGQLVWKRRQTVDSRALHGLSVDHEYVLAYSRGAASLLGKPIDLGKFKNPDNDPRGPWWSADITGLATAAQRPNLHYALVDPQTCIEYGCPENGWRYSRESMALLIGDGRVIWPQSPKGRPRLKRFRSDRNDDLTNLSSVLATAYTAQGTRTLKELFGGSEILEFPKPVELVSLLVEQCIAKDAIVLDFFAGSGTTAHAVMEQNAKDGGNRKFILVQLPEPTENPQYPTIAHITRERVRRAAAQLKAQSAGTLDVDGNGPQELGFRAFRLAESNFKPWDQVGSSSAPELATQLALHVDHVRHDRTAADMLYEILLKSGLPLTTLVQEMEIAGKQVFAVAEGALVICLEQELTLELVRGIAELKPERVVMLDTGFAGNDQLKTNAVQTFKTSGVAGFKVV